MLPRRRLVRVGAAIVALTVVAGALDVFAKPGSVAVASGGRGRVVVTGGSTSSTTAAAPTTSAAVTTIVPPSSSTAPTGAAAAAAVTSVAPTTMAPTTATPTTAATTTPLAPTTTDPSQRWGTGIVTMTFVDHSRSTPAAGSDPAVASRTLPTIVRYPIDSAAGDVAGAAASRRGPFPLIVFASGYNTTPDEYATLTRSWAAAGYVVAVPAFPRNQMGKPLNEDDVANQPGDVSFVITSLLAVTRAAGPLAGAIDPNHIGAAGHSDGGVTALGVGENSCCRDPRISADVVGSGDEERYTGTWYPPGAPPLLVVQGDEDPINPPSSGRQVFLDAHAPKYLLWLLGAGHLEPFTTDLPHLRVVEDATLAFFDRYLKGRPAAAAQLQAAATPGLATLTAG